MDDNKAEAVETGSMGWYPPRDPDDHVWDAVDGCWACWGYVLYALMDEDERAEFWTSTEYVSSYCDTQLMALFDILDAAGVPLS
jgi:hypothetical protein